MITPSFGKRSTKPRARRVTIAAAVLGGGVVAVLAIAHWRAVCDHVKAWRFQLTRKAETIEPGSHGPWPVEEKMWRFDLAGCLLVLATHSGLPVLIESPQTPEERVSAFVITNPSEPPDTWVLLTEESARRQLQTNGYRVLEQRFPRRAYVVIREGYDGMLWMGD